MQSPNNSVPARRPLPNPPTVNQKISNNQLVKSSTRDRPEASQASEVSRSRIKEVSNSVLLSANLGRKEDPKGTSDLSDQFFHRVLDPNPQNGMQSAFEMINSKSFGTDRIIVINSGNRSSEINIKLTLTVFVLGTENDVHARGEVQIHVGASQPGVPIGSLSAYTRSIWPIKRRKDGELEFSISGGNLFIDKIEVVQKWQRIGIGRNMVNLLLGQARAYGIITVEVAPFSFLGDGRLEDGRDRAEVFWEAMGFEGHRKQSQRYDDNVSTFTQAPPLDIET